MGYNPWINAAKAAYAEVSSDEAIAFLKATALSHTLLVAFYALDAVHWTVEAGKLSRSFVDSFSTPKQAAQDSTEPCDEISVAGLLCPAIDALPITTEAIVTNQQKLEQFITQQLQEINDNVKTNQESDRVGSEEGDKLVLEPIQESSVQLRGEDRKSSDRPTPTTRPSRRRNSGAASSDRSKAKAQTPSNRVSRKSGEVPQE